MKKAIRGVVVALAGLAAFGVAQAANWMPVGATDPNGGVFTVDQSSIRLEPDGVVRAWFQVEFSTPQAASNGKTFSSAKFIDRFYCKTGMLSRGPEYKFDSQGNSISAIATYDPPTDVVPGTIGETLFNYACTTRRIRMKADSKASNE